MDKSKQVDGIYKVLALYEDAIDENSTVTKEDYESYLHKLAILHDGLSHSDMAGYLRGLAKSSTDLPHKRVRSVVFHMINMIENNIEG